MCRFWTGARRLLGFTGVGIIVAVLVLSFLAHGIETYNPETRVWRDWFGRPLSHSPLVPAWPGGSERSAGLLWFIVDTALFVLGLAAGGALAAWGLRRLAKRHEDEFP